MRKFKSEWRQFCHRMLLVLTTLFDFRFPCGQLFYMIRYKWVRYVRGILESRSTLWMKTCLVCKHNFDYNIRHTSHSLKLSYIVLLLEWFPVEWCNPFLKIWNIDYVGLFLKVWKLWKSAFTKIVCSKWFSIHMH